METASVSTRAALLSLPGTWGTPLKCLVFFDQPRAGFSGLLFVRFGSTDLRAVMLANTRSGESLMKIADDCLIILP